MLVVFAMARMRYGTLTAGLAAVLMAAHPVAAAYSMQAMSDIPATLATVVAVYALAARREPLPVVAGLAASLAIMIARRWRCQWWCSVPRCCAARREPHGPWRRGRCRACWG